MKGRRDVRDADARSRTTVLRRVTDVTTRDCLRCFVFEELLAPTEIREEVIQFHTTNSTLFIFCFSLFRGTVTWEVSKLEQVQPALE